MIVEISLIQPRDPQKDVRLVLESFGEDKHHLYIREYQEIDETSRTIEDHKPVIAKQKYVGWVYNEDLAKLGKSL